MQRHVKLKEVNGERRRRRPGPEGLRCCTERLQACRFQSKCSGLTLDPDEFIHIYRAPHRAVQFNLKRRGSAILRLRNIESVHYSLLFYTSSCEAANRWQEALH